MGKMFWLGLSIPEPNQVIGHSYLYDIIFLSQMKFRVRLIIKVDSNEDQSLLIMPNIYNKEKRKEIEKVLHAMGTLKWLPTRTKVF